MTALHCWDDMDKHESMGITADIAIQYIHTNLIACVILNEVIFSVKHSLILVLLGRAFISRVVVLSTSLAWRLITLVD